MKAAELNYPIYNKELLAIIKVFKEWKPGLALNRLVISTRTPRGRSNAMPVPPTTSSTVLRNSSTFLRRT
jgi:hypothetical protein